MKIRLLAAATLLVGTAACGSYARETTSLTSAGRPTSTTASSPTTTSAPATPMESGAAASDSSSAALPASSPDAPAAGRLAPSAPSQTLTTLPSNSFLVTSGGVRYYCEPQGYDDDQSDCVRYYGGSAPYVNSPELYCSDSVSPECSEDWYPAELARADMITMGAQTYVCRRTVLGGIGDKDCAPYRGGDPTSVSYVNAMKCSPMAGGLQCDDQYYPSEWEDLTQVTIGYDDYICKSSYRGNECWEWSGYGSPKSATYGLPDLYCNSSGTCAEDGYPSRY